MGLYFSVYFYSVCNPCDKITCGLGSLNQTHQSINMTDVLSFFVIPEQNQLLCCLKRPSFVKKNDVLFQFLHSTTAIF